jgi:ABC-type nitrate/sulfonate/bicarbonate transport system substrate-binding protein
MPKFAITPHFRLHEWVAEEKGYFKAQGLDYEFHGIWEGQDLAKAHETPNKVGAYQSFEQGRDTNVSCACHWTVNVAASKGHGKMYVDAYSVSPAAVFVPPESPIRNPEDLRGVPISVGYQSGSHYSTIQALEQYMPLSDIKLSFADGILFSRLEKLIDRKVPAAALFSGPYYFLEQLGFRKVIDTTFMMATMITGNPDPSDLKKYFAALRLAQRDIDLRPELHTKHYRNEFPKRFLPEIDTRRWGPGERIVFEPYTKEVFENSFKWIRERNIFEPGTMGEGCYEDVCVSLAEREALPT